MKFYSFAVAIYMAFCLVNPASGFFKYLGTTPLVANPDPKTVYLFQFPRTAHVPTSVYYFSALNTKVETWLSLQKIKFHRVSNLAAVSSTQKGVVPFALFNGKFYEGSDQIIEELIEEVDKQIDFKKAPNQIIENAAKNASKFIVKNVDKFMHGPEEKELRRLIDDKLFKILMVDRATRNEQGKGGLDWFLTDEALMEQVVPLYQPKGEFAIKLGEVDYVFLLHALNWMAYFNVLTVPGQKGYYRHGKCPQEIVIDECIRPKLQFMAKTLSKAATGEKADMEFSFDHWKIFNKELQEKVVQQTLKETFVKVEDFPKYGADSESLINKLLEQNSYLAKKPGFSEATLTPLSKLKGNGKEALKYLNEILETILSKLRTSKQFLFGNKPTPADASLFAVLVQFFETPLNIPEFELYFQAKELDKDAQVLKDFVTRMKDELGLGEKGWAKLRQKPWTLNYEQKNFAEDMGGKKYDGPFIVPNVGDLTGIFPNDVKTSPVNVKDAPEEIQKVMGKIEEYVINLKGFVRKETKNCLFRMMAAYLCKNSFKVWNCENEHREKATKLNCSGLINATEMFEKTRQITYETIVAYNDQKNLGLMVQAMMQSAGNKATGDWVNLRDKEF